MVSGVNGLLTNITFHQIGGRCRLVCEDDVVSCLKGDIVVSERFRAIKKKNNNQKEAKAAARQDRQCQQRLQQDRERVINWLKYKKFDLDVNAEKKTGFFLWRSYPILEAARDKDWHMICLLLYFGADPNRRDSRGKTVFDYVNSENLKEKVSSMYAKSRLGPQETIFGHS